MYALRLRLDGTLEDALAALPARGRFCLDGRPGHPEGRWTFFGAEPEETVEARWGGSALEALSALDAFEARGPGAPGALEGDAIPLAPAAVPRWVGFVAYDAAWSRPRAFGLRAPARHARDPRWPIAWMGRYERLVAVDLDGGGAWALGPSRAACEALGRAVRAGRAPREAPRVGAIVGAIDAEPAALHRARIERALDAIRAGTIYQVNLARAWRARWEGSPLTLYAAMRAASPVPLGALLELDEGAVASRSMERFLRWDRATGALWTSPIKGTIARAGDDAGEARALSADDKERAEHAMIVDLMRNDLSRVAATGTVEVEAPLRVEPFAKLSHLVSTVRCRTRPDATLGDVLAATFPPGSVTGTPKLAAMELIERGEACARGLYTGALGFVDRGGGLSLSVAIRTATILGGELTYFAGGGLVSASDPGREIAETELKARVWFDALASIGRKNID
ncbi:MAG: anthranilate synthase component I family protein [Sandaracinaceae bacterium]|nr:anthranilate synthase component I family protein [Sandaracinaceae bacterium]